MADAFSAGIGIIAKETRVVIEQLSRSEIIVEVRLFRKVTDHLMGANIFNRAAADPCRSRRGKNKPHQELHRGGFSGAVRTKESQHLAFFHLKREAVERPAHSSAPKARWIILGESKDLDCRITHGT